MNNRTLANMLAKPGRTWTVIVDHDLTVQLDGTGVERLAWCRGKTSRASVRRVCEMVEFLNDVVRVQGGKTVSVLERVFATCFVETRVGQDPDDYNYEQAGPEFEIMFERGHVAFVMGALPDGEHAFRLVFRTVDAS